MQVAEPIQVVKLKEAWATTC